MTTFLPAHAGEIAALGAALCWALSSLAFAAAGRRIGPTAVNLARILVALAVLLVLSRLLSGRWVPPVETRGVVLLGVSGVVGLALGDQLLFTAFVDIGPRLSVLLMTIAPPVTALLAWPVLGERLEAVPCLGIAITLMGIVWVVRERPGPSSASSASPPPARHRARGVVLGLGAGLCQAVGLVLSKLGMGHGPDASVARVDPWTATLYRMVFAAVGVTILVGTLRLVRGPAADRTMAISPEVGHLPPRRRTPGQAYVIVLMGVAFGPVLGVWSSMVAVDRAEAGIAATLMATTPVMILPFAIWIEKEHVTWRAAIGAAVAVAGVGVLLLAHS